MKNIYSMLAALTSGDEALASAIAIITGSDEKALCEEAKKVLEILDAYEEPTPPFADVTKEDIEKEREYLDRRYGFLIWTDQNVGSDEDCAEMVMDDPEHYKGYTEDDLRRLSAQNNTEEIEILKPQFADIGPSGLLIVGTSKQWNNTTKGFRTMDSLSDVFSVFTGGMSTLYIQDGRLKGENIFQDGSDDFTFYIFRDEKSYDRFVRDVDANNFEFDNPLAHAGVENPVPLMDKVFGWSRDNKEVPDNGKECRHERPV